MPVIRQALMTTAEDFTGDPSELERRLFLARKAFERGGRHTYVCSLSTRTLVYKAMCTGRTLQRLLSRLAEPQYTTHFAVFHQRYATNVLPSWDRAQPLRMVAHNGEINTVWSNRAHVDARSSLLPRECDPLFTPRRLRLDEPRRSRRVAVQLRPQHRRSCAHDAASGRSASGNRLFHRYHSDIMEPWDGPSALVSSPTADLLGAALDRNGLRPCRFVITDGGLIVAGSEVGLADVDTDTIIRSGRLGPGQMILLDLDRSRLIEGAELDRYFDDLSPYSELIEDIPLEAAATPVTALEKDELTRLQRGFGYTREEVKMVRHADGGRRQGGGLVHGRRHAHRAAGSLPAPGLRILPPAFCAGHKPANRFAARVLRGLAAHAPRPVAAPARQARARSRPRAAVAVSFARARWLRCTRAATRCAISSLWRSSTAVCRRLHAQAGACSTCRSARSPWSAAEFAFS